MFKTLTLVLIFLSLLGTAQERVMEIWNKNELSVKPVEKLQLKVNEKIHYSATRGNIQLKYAEVMLGHHLLKWMEYGGAYRITSSWIISDVWETENRAMVFVDFSEPIHKFKLSFANRFEYRSFKHLENHFRYRQSLKLDFPSLSPWGMRFYVSEESFYKFNNDGTHLARLYAGLTVLEKQHFNFSTYYALQKAKLADKWFTGDVLGLNFNFSI